MPFPFSEKNWGGRNLPAVGRKWKKRKGKFLVLRVRYCSNHITINQNGIFHNRLYYVSINMSKKYLPKYQKLTKKLRFARLSVRLTQVEAGKKLKKPQAYISKIERGERSVDALELAEFAKIYKKDITYFI